MPRGIYKRKPSTNYNFIDLTGKVFGRWLVLSRKMIVPSQTHWLCLCSCGTKKVVKGQSLIVGDSKSCGCYKLEVSTKHGLNNSPTRSSYIHMIQRCYNPKDTSFRHYGGRGIKVCKRWKGPLGLVNFAADMGLRPKGLTLDRIDNDGNYEPTNCKWSTKSEQQYNRRPPTLATKAKLSASMTGRAEGGHVRWHINQNIISPTCKLCAK